MYLIFIDESRVNKKLRSRSRMLITCQMDYMWWWIMMININQLEKHPTYLQGCVGSDKCQ